MRIWSAVRHSGCHIMPGGAAGAEPACDALPATLGTPLFGDVQDKRIAPF
jgi:hypothetical protein